MSDRISNGNLFDSIACYTNLDGQDQSNTTAQTKGKSVTQEQTPDDYIVKSGDTLTKLAERRGISLNTILRDNPNIKNPNKIFVGQHLNLTGGAAKTIVYTVKRGDTLTEIAEKHHSTVGNILRVNKGEIRNLNLIFPGQHIHIPVKTNSHEQQPNQPTNTPEIKQPTQTPPKNNAAPQIQTTQTSVTRNEVTAGKINIDEFLSPAKGSSAICAVVIGNAEGNRYEDGKPTPHFYGHEDPGDGLWNIGSFSRSNERFKDGPKAQTPEEADRLHLQHMQKAKVEYIEGMKKAGLDPENALLASTFLDTSNQSERASKKMLAPENLAYIKEKGVTVETMKDWRLGGFVNLKTGERWLKDGKPVGGGLAKIAHERMAKKEGRRATEQEIQQTIRQDQGRRVDAMVKALKNLKLLNIVAPPKSQPEVAQKTPTENKPNTESSSQKADGVVFDKPNSGAIDTLLPASGKGYVTYKNDGNDHYGTAQTVKALQTIAAKWSEKHSELKIQIGDMSRKGGGYLAPHGSHKKGIDADIRPFRKDGKLTGLNAVADPQNFDREKTRELIKIVKEIYPNTVILFNDKQLIKEGLTKPWEGHNDHLHIRFK